MAMNTFKPMRAAMLEQEHWTKLQFPLFASTKLDGIRACLIRSPRTGNRLLASKSLKRIPNLHIRHSIESSQLPDWLDGELIVGDTFGATTSAVMSINGEPNFHYWVFDYLPSGPQEFWINRHDRMQRELAKYEKLYPWFHVMQQTVIEDLPQLDAFYHNSQVLGHEGVILKHPRRIYVYGKCTLSGQACLKIKPTLDADAVVTGFEELMHNDNDDCINALGYTERSSELSGLSPGGTLGSLVVRPLNNKWPHFKIGTGFTQEQRTAIWTNKEHYIHKHLTFKYQKHNMKDKPRQPVFLRWRPDLDEGL